MTDARDNETGELDRWNHQRLWSAKQTIKDHWLGTISHFTTGAKSGDPSHPAEIWYGRLSNEYSNPDRHYHNLEHVRLILDLTPIVRRTFETVEELLAFQLGAWFHDAVYDTQRSDNEQRSAGQLESAAKDLSVPDEVNRIATQWILATKHHNPSDPAAGAFCDADLAILGSPPAVYRKYQADIRREYAWVPEAEYRTGRSRVLQHFLALDRVYQTPAMYELLESNARRNMNAELTELF